MAAPSSSPLLARLQAELKPLHDRLLKIFQFGRPVRSIEPRDEGTPFNPVTRTLFQDLAQSGVKFGLINNDYRAAGPFQRISATEKMFGADSRVPEKDQRIAMTYNRCRLGAVALWSALTILYAAGHSDITSFKQQRQGVKPKLILFAEDDLGKEWVFSHDFFVLTAANGSRFVFDPTGYQFGFHKFLYTYEEYHESCLDSDSVPEFPDSDDEFKEVSWAASRRNQQDNKNYIHCMVAWDVWGLREELGSKTRAQIQAGDVW